MASLRHLSYVYEHGIVPGNMTFSVIIERNYNDHDFGSIILSGHYVTCEGVSQCGCLHAPENACSFATDTGSMTL